MTHPSLFKRLTATVTVVVGSWLMTGLPVSATTPTYVQTHVSIIADNQVLADSDQYIADSGCTITDSAGVDHVIVDAMAICAFDQAADSVGLTYSADYYDGMGLFVSTIGDTATASDYSQSWLFYINGQSAMVGADSATMVDGDAITFAYGPWPSTPLTVSLSKAQLLTGKTLTATVQYYSDAGILTPAVGATVHAGKQLGTTDATGRVSFTFTKPGVKQVYAELADYTRTVNQTVVLFPAHARSKAVVTKAQTQMIKKASAYLQADTTFGVTATSQSLTDWSAMALANTPLKISTLKKNVGQFDSTATTVAATDIARNTLAAAAVGQTKRARLLADLLVTSETPCSDGYVNDEIYSVLAWSAAGATHYKHAIADSVECVLQSVTADGGVALTTGGAADVDTTAAFVQMAASFKHPKRLGLDAAELKSAKRAAVRFLKHTQNPDGGWGYAPEAVSNTSSTATAVMALTAVGLKPGQVQTNHRSGFNYLKSVQNQSGAFAYDNSGTQSVETLNTAYAIMALQHVALPVNKYRK